MRFAFLDTTTILQFRSLDDIDWCGLLGDDSVRLVVSQHLIRELNRHKDAEAGKRLRKRAAAALKRLREHIRHSLPPQVREGVELYFREKEPTIDFAVHKLNEKVSDDWLIATILEFRNESTDLHVSLVTNDVGLLLKAGAYGIECVELPDEYALPPEPDQDQTRIQELELEIAKYKHSAPILRLVFEDGKDYRQFKLTKLALTTDAAISGEMEKLRVRRPKEVKREGYSGADLMRGALGPLDIDRYNERMDGFYAAYERYLREVDTTRDSTTPTNSAGRFTGQ